MSKFYDFVETLPPRRADDDDDGVNLSPAQLAARDARARADRKKAALVKFIRPATAGVVSVGPEKVETELFVDPPITIRGVGLQSGQKVDAVGLGDVDFKFHPSPEVKTEAPKHVRNVHQWRITFPSQPDGTQPDGKLWEGMPNVDLVRKLVSEALGGECPLLAQDLLEGYRWSYKQGCTWHDVEDRTLARLLWTEGRAEACLDIVGCGGDRLGVARNLKLMRTLNEKLKVKCRRIDPYFDDYTRSVTIDTIRSAIKARNISGFKKYKSFDPRDLSKPDGDDKDEDGIALGKRGDIGSGKAMRIYDRNLLPTGAVNCIRYEGELTDEHAEAAWKALVACETPEAFIQRTGEILGGLVRFVDRASVSGGYATDVKKMELLPWWKSLLEAMCASMTFALELNPKGITGPLAGGLKHLRKQWGKTMALARVICDSVGISWAAVLDAWMDEKEPQINWDQQGKRNLGLTLKTLLAT